MVFKAPFLVVKSPVEFRILLAFLSKYHSCGMQMPYTWDCGNAEIAVPLQRQTKVKS
jgi:hypothetical protein